MVSRNPIIADIISKRRTFLGGSRCTAAEVRKHFADNILIDGLGLEESELVLSTLPPHSNRIYLNPLDKGLSGSKVFAGRYQVNKKLRSKPFVFKIGPIKKIQREYDAIVKFVEPLIQGIEAPILRRGKDKGLLIQVIAGLSANSELQSLKEYVRTNKNGDDVLTRLLSDRLAGWYNGEHGASPVKHSLKKMFKWYLQKVTKPDPYPKDWNDLKGWVQGLTHLRWGSVPEVMNSLKETEVSSRSCIVHGDLHSQNVLIDEKGECWPIDFGWCHQRSSPLLDFTMLECSLKFLAIHQRSDLRSAILIEDVLARDGLPDFRKIGKIPYRDEIENVLRAVLAVRRFAFGAMKIKFEDYRKALCLMTYVHATHPQLNRPFILASLQILSAIEQKTI
jgi:hypothetical protein